MLILSFRAVWINKGKVTVINYEVRHIKIGNFKETLDNEETKGSVRCKYTVAE